MWAQRLTLLLALVAGLLISFAVPPALGGGCTAPDFEGAIIFPANCPYLQVQDNIRITDGLPPGSTLEITAPISAFHGVLNHPGGVLGGSICLFNAHIMGHVSGTGLLAGYEHFIDMPLQGEIHISPMQPGEDVQTFGAVVMNLSGALTDSDFTSLVLTVEPQSLGQTEISRLPGGEWAVDSFFDITYHIDFKGAPGSPLAGMAGTSTGNVRIQTEKPKPVSTHFMIAGEEDWLRALNPEPGSSMVRPLMPHEWQEYMDQYNDPQNLDGNPPYPPTEFLHPELYVMPCRGEGPGGCVDGEDAGLVMAWGDPQMPKGEYASAWVYQYGQDPDLSNSTVTIQVEAPCGIQQISLGLLDANGLRRGWYWNVAALGMPGGAGVLTCSPPMGPTVRHTITVDLSKTGVSAASPVAWSYSNAGGFDITKVISFVFDENFQWIPGVAANVPPPGQVDPKPWNYWFNLSVHPNAAAYKGNYVKYSQPPVELKPGLINGWDEVSLYRMGPIMADDWKCSDERPVTDIHWWGSFIGWTESKPPQVVPTAFHIGIWTDVPAGADSQYSHPGVLVWENVCSSWVWNFAGYDLDPRIDHPDHTVNEACFQFNQLLSENEWFHQHPMADGKPNIYWLSIAAIYPPDTQIRYPWGWKTRPHFFQDDAVRIRQASKWPPAVGDTWVAGEPVEYPQGVSWDLAFELTTNKPAYADMPIPGDLDLDGSVNFVDFAIFAGNWLVSAP